MIILDTNVVSELMRKSPDPTVINWFRHQESARLYLSAITVAEIRRGLALLPDGKRKKELQAAFEFFLEAGFGGRILPFTKQTSEVYAPLYQKRVEAGLGVGEFDLLIAAIAKENGASVATRNTDDFKSCGIRLINPWEQPKGGAG